MRRRFRGPTVTLRYLARIKRRDGSYDTYVRIKGQPAVRMPDRPHDHPDFLAAYAAAVGAVPRDLAPREGSVAALARIAKASDAFAALSDGYRRTTARNLDAIAEAGRNAMHSGLKQRHVEADCEKAPSSVDRLKAWRFMCAVNKRRMTSDPTIGVRIERPKSEGHPPWTADDIAAFRARWGIETAARRAMELLYWTGARIGDACVIGPGHVRDGVLSFRQGKTGDTAHVPWSCVLADHAAHMLTDRDIMHEALAYAPRQMTFLATGRGAPRSSKSMGQMLRLAARDAGIQKSAHGLRKARAVALAEGGATTHQIAAWTGHQSLKEVERYTRAASRRRANMGSEQEQNTSTHSAPSRTQSGK